MTPDPRFIKQPKCFWAHVRSISQEIGYTEREKRTVRTPTLDEVLEALRSLTLNTEHVSPDGRLPTPFGKLLLDYFRYRAEFLNKKVEPLLMDAEAAEAIFKRLCKKYARDATELPMNKQKGTKRKNAFLTGMVNILVKANIGLHDCDFDPRSLTTVTKDGQPLRTLARRVDGAFPAVVNPIAIWEIKEYYHTTTFGSRVADGVYETLLDGMELEELQEHEQKTVRHVLMIDSHFTWWQCGRSYLCRIVDMLHMGYVDQVLFGKEVVNRLPIIVKEWVSELEKRTAKTSQGGDRSQVPGQANEPAPEGTVGTEKPLGTEA